MRFSNGGRAAITPFHHGGRDGAPPDGLWWSGGGEVRDGGRRMQNEKMSVSHIQAHGMGAGQGGKNVGCEFAKKPMISFNLTPSRQPRAAVGRGGARCGKRRGNLFPWCGKSAETCFHCVENRPKHASIAWKNPQNTVPLCGKPPETRFHCVEKLRGRRRVSCRRGRWPRCGRRR